MTPISRAQHLQAVMQTRKDNPPRATSGGAEETTPVSPPQEDEQRVRDAIAAHLANKARKRAEEEKLDVEHHRRPTGGPKQGFLPWLAQKLNLR